MSQMPAIHSVFPSSVQQAATVSTAAPVAAAVATTTPSARPPANRVVGWENRGGESATPYRNVDFINGPPQGYAGSPVEQSLAKFAAQGWTRVAVRSPWGTSADGVLRFEQPLDCLDQNFGWLDSSYRQLRSKLLKSGIVEWIDYVGSPETLVSRTTDPIYHRDLDAIADAVLSRCGSSVGFDDTSGVSAGSFTHRIFEKCDLAGVRVYVEAIAAKSSPHLWHRPFFVQESFNQTVEAQQSTGHQADWAATRSDLTGERICILDQPPPGADWQHLDSLAWRTAIMAILSRGDTVAVDPGVILAQWPHPV